MPEILIANGLLYDGTGKEPFFGSVLINDDRISKIFRGKTDLKQWKKKSGLMLIDAAGLAVTPGFIDIHRHCDIQPFFGTGFGVPVLAQGITTVVAGNCGFSMTPVSEDEKIAEETYSFAEPVLGKPYRKIKRFEEYMNYLDQARLPVNFVSMIGCGTVKTAVKVSHPSLLQMKKWRKQSDILTMLWRLERPEYLQELCIFRNAIIQ